MIVYQHQRITLHHGDCLAVLRTLPTASVDSLVTDPPAGIGFMGAAWDGDKGGRRQWIAWLADVLTEARRVCKPGAHALVWALPRTSHWTATALEDAGWEIRDCLYHIFGSGFPKNLDISKALDKVAGAEREIVGQSVWKSNNAANQVYGKFNAVNEHLPITAPATLAAQAWQGWGTALKPAVECWWLARAPLSESSIARNVARWGTGAINVDGCRVPAEPWQRASRGREGYLYQASDFRMRDVDKASHDAGRWPPHLLLSHGPACTPAACDPGCPVAVLDSQSGVQPSTIRPNRAGKIYPNKTQGIYGEYTPYVEPVTGYEDSGGASRFFPVFWPDPDPPFLYTAKASTSERHAGLDTAPTVAAHTRVGRAADSAGLQSPRAGAGRTSAGQNHHPTVKSIALMTWLCTLVTPPGGTILDPFGGSGPVPLVAQNHDWGAVYIEQEAAYCEIAKGRLIGTAPLFHHRETA